MSETPEAYHTAQPTALDTYVAQRRTDASVAKQANWQLYQLMLTETAHLLHGSEQMTQDVLHQVCVEHNSKPNDVLMLVRDFLRTFQERQGQEQEAAPEPVQAESLFFAREA